MPPIPTGQTAKAKYWADEEKTARGIAERLKLREQKADAEVRKRENALQTAENALQTANANLAKIRADLVEADLRHDKAHEGVGSNREDHHYG